MNIGNIILAAYPCYLSLEALKKPRIEEMKHLLIMWILWYCLSLVGLTINMFLFWIPFIGIFDTIKLIILILAIRGDIANNFRSLLIAPMWNKIKRRVPVYWNKILELSETIFPKIQQNRYYLMTYLNKLKHLILLTPISPTQKNNPYIDPYLDQHPPSSPSTSSSTQRVKLRIIE